MTMESTVREKLMIAFEPTRLDVENQSHQHAGHAGDDGSGESHFSVKIVSKMFDGKSRVERHRMVNEALASELAHGIHALAVSALAPGDK